MEKEAEYEHHFGTMNIFSFHPVGFGPGAELVLKITHFIWKGENKHADWFHLTGCRVKH